MVTLASGAPAPSVGSPQFSDCWRAQRLVAFLRPDAVAERSASELGEVRSRDAPGIPPRAPIPAAVTSGLLAAILSAAEVTAPAVRATSADKRTRRQDIATNVRAPPHALALQRDCGISALPGL